MKPDPSPSAGNHPRLIANTVIRTNAATNAGMAADPAVSPRTTSSIGPDLSAPIVPIKRPNTTVSSAANAISSIVTGSSDLINDETLCWWTIE
jgi:hypothetical protein